MVKFAPSALALTVAVAIHAVPVYGWFRMLCSGNTLVRERIDPVIQPGVNPSQHVHTVQGSNNFGKGAMDYATLRQGTCNTCIAKEDLSAYWYPQLYFHAPNGSFIAVGNGGLDVYYLQRGSQEKVNGGPGLKAFPAGFKMLTGSPINRRYKGGDTGLTAQQKLAADSTSWICLRYGANQPDVYSDTVPGQGFPTSNCESGFQTRLQFPSCWDGTNVDSSDHHSHVAYLSGLDNGDCPSTHPVGLVHLFYEVTWDVAAFATSGAWNPSTDGWRFVWSIGDPTGWGWHGDFQAGWDPTLQQNTIDNCNNQNNDQQANGVIEGCTLLTLQSEATYSSCTAAPLVSESIGKWGSPLSKLPGCNPLQSGPGDATIYYDNNCPV